MSTQPPLTLIEYETIYRTVYSVIEHEWHNLTDKCYPFNAFAADIISKHTNLKPNIECGFFGIKFGKEDDPINNLIQGNVDSQDKPFSDADNYHAWIKIDDWIIDFSAPIYGEILKIMLGKTLFNPKMFQKHINEMKNSIHSLKNSGDFFCVVNPELTKHIISANSNRLYDYLSECCIGWYNSDYGKMKKVFKIKDIYANIDRVNLHYEKIKDAW